MASGSKLELLIEIQGKNAELLAGILRTVTDLQTKVEAGNKSLNQVAENTNSNLTNALRSAKTGALDVLGAFGLWRGIGDVISFVKDSLDKFSESERIAAKLAGSIAAAGGDFKTLQPLIRGATADMQKYGVTDHEVAAALADLVNRGFSVKQSLQGVQAAEKLAMLEGISLSEAVHAITNASNGFIRPGSVLGQILHDVRDELQKGGDKGKNFQVVLDKLAHLDPAIQAQLDTLALKTKTLGANWQQFSENFGSWLARVTDAKENLEFLSNWFKSLNDETERSNRIAAGHATAADNLETLIRQRDAIARFRADLKAGSQLPSVVPTGETLSPQDYREQTKAVENALQSIGISKMSFFTGAQREQAIAGLELVTRQLNQRILAMNKQGKKEIVDANKEADRQDKVRLEESAALERKKMDKLIEEGSSDELRKRAQLMGQVFAAEMQTSEAEYKQKLQLLDGNLSGQLALIEEHGKTVVATEQKQADQITQLLEGSSEKSSTSIQTMFKGGGADLAPGAISGFAESGDWAGLVAKAREMNKKFALDPADFKQAHDEFQTLSADIQKLTLLKQQASKIEVTAGTQTQADTKSVTDKAMSESEAKYRGTVSTNKDLVASGDLSQGEAMRQNAAAAQQYATKLRELAATGKLTDAQLVKFTKDLANVQREASKLTTLGQIRSQLTQFSNNLTHLGQQIGQFLTSTLDNALSTASAAITDMITRTGNAAAAWRNFGMAAIQAITQMVTGYIAGKLAMMAVDAMFGAESKAQSASTAAVAAPAGVAKAGEQGGIWGVILYAIVFATVLAAVMGMVAAASGGFAEGGPITGGVPGRDSVPFIGMTGEHVIKASSVSSLGERFMSRINAGIVDLAALNPGAVVRGMARPMSGNDSAGGQGGAGGRGNAVQFKFNNAIAFTQSDRERLFATTEFRRSLHAFIATNPDAINASLNRQRGHA